MCFIDGIIWYRAKDAEVAKLVRPHALYLQYALQGRKKKNRKLPP